MKNKIVYIEAVILSVGFMFLFFGGTWEGVRFGLEIFGGVFVIQTVYNQLIKGKESKKEKEKINNSIKKHF